MRTPLGLVLLVLSIPAWSQTLAITGGRLAIGDGGEPIDGATVLLREGRVIAAGAGVTVPAGATVIDAKGKWVTPGLVGGLSRIGITEVGNVAGVNDMTAAGSVWSAALDVSLGINPRATAIPIHRVQGMTRAAVPPGIGSTMFGGQGAVIDLGDDMNAVMKPRAFQFVSFGDAGASKAGGSRPAAFVQFRSGLQDAQRYARRPSAYAAQGPDTLPRLDAAALVPVLHGEIPLLVHVDRAIDILNVLALREEFPKLKLVLVGAGEGWTVAERIAAAGVPVIASAIANVAKNFDTLAATQSNIGRLRAAGIVVGIGILNFDEDLVVKRMTQNAGDLVALSKVPGASGLTWGAAFAALTSAPAEALGLGAEIGSLRPGRRADAVIWSGDPLELSSVAERVWIDGVEQPLETRQTKLRDRYRTPREGALPKAYEQ